MASLSNFPTDSQCIMLSVRLVRKFRLLLNLRFNMSTIYIMHLNDLGKIFLKTIVHHLK